MSVEKIFITANELLDDSYRLAAQIIESGFKPNFIVGVWRGGTPVGIAVQEFLDHCGIQTDHISIRTSSYYGVEKRNREVRVHGLDYLIDNINNSDRLLIVDDVFDTGSSIQAIIERLSEKTRLNMPCDVRVATAYYKPSKNLTNRIPEYFVHQVEDWLVFPHELNGLSQEEVKQKSPLVSELVEKLNR